MGLSVALSVGFIIGLFSVVPYLGFMIGIVLASIATVIQFQDWWHFIYLMIIFAVGNITESYILMPLLVGDRVGLHPVTVIFAILAGGQLFGFIGILLAVPVAAVIMVLLRFAKERYLQSPLYHQTEAH